MVAPKHYFSCWCGLPRKSQFLAFKRVAWELGLLIVTEPLEHHEDEYLRA